MKEGNGKGWVQTNGYQPEDKDIDVNKALDKIKRSYTSTSTTSTSEYNPDVYTVTTVPCTHDDTTLSGCGETNCCGKCCNEYKSTSKNSTYTKMSNFQTFCMFMLTIFIVSLLVMSFEVRKKYSVEFIDYVNKWANTQVAVDLDGNSVITILEHKRFVNIVIKEFVDTYGLIYIESSGCLREQGDTNCINNTDLIIKFDSFIKTFKFNERLL